MNSTPEFASLQRRLLISGRRHNLVFHRQRFSFPLAWEGDVRGLSQQHVLDFCYKQTTDDVIAAIHFAYLAAVRVKSIFGAEL